MNHSLGLIVGALPFGQWKWKLKLKLNSKLSGWGTMAAKVGQCVEWTLGAWDLKGREKALARRMENAAEWSVREWLGRSVRAADTLRRFGFHLACRFQWASAQCTVHTLQCIVPTGDCIVQWAPNLT